MATLMKMSSKERDKLLSNPDNVVMDYVEKEEDSNKYMIDDMYKAIIKLHKCLTQCNQPKWTFEQRCSYVVRNNVDIREFKLQCPNLWKLYAIEKVKPDSWEILKFMNSVKNEPNADGIVQNYMLNKFAIKKN